MVTFDSPVERCPNCREMVLLDQTVCECAEEHGCEAEDCPIKQYFAGVNFRAEEAERKKRP